MNNPVVSVITVSFNSAEFIRTAIDSVISQTYPEIEYIIIDGGSDDDTVSIVQSYGDRVTHLVSEPDKGIYDAMNKGLSLATGDVVCILNSDDFYPNKNVISNVVSRFSECPDDDVLLANVDFVKPSDLMRPVRFYSSFYFQPWKMRFGLMPAHPSSFMKRSAYDKVGKYKLGYKIGADFEWFVRAFLVHDLKYVKVDEVYVRMREGGVSTSGLKSYWLSSIEQVKALRCNNIYTNFCFVLIRLPIKFFHKFFRKGRS